MLGHVRIGAADDDAEIGGVGETGPHFLAVDHPFIALAHRLGADAGEIGARRRFGEELAPDFLAQQRLGHITLYHFGVAVGEDGGDAHAKANGIEALRHVPAAFFLAIDDAVHGRQALAAEHLGPGDAGVAGGVLLGLPRFRSRDEFRQLHAFGRRIAIFGGILVQPGAHNGAKFGFLRGVVKIHDVSPEAVFTLDRSICRGAFRHAAALLRCSSARTSRSAHQPRGPSAATSARLRR